MKKYSIFFIVLYFIFAPFHYSLGATNSGFIPGQIWYSKDPFVEGDTIKIYTAVWNNDTSSLNAKVEFYDKNVILGTREVSVPASNLMDVSISWKVTSGDHSISAKIISPTITASGKKQNVTLSNNTTETDKRFIPVVVKTSNGDTATSSDIIKSQVDKATSSLDSILPDSISSPITDKVDTVDEFRSSTAQKLSTSKLETEKKISELKKEENSKSKINNSSQSKESIDDATEKPIAYLKLIFLSVLSFIFNSKIVFYLLIILILFLIIRSVYRRIKNRY